MTAPRILVVDDEADLRELLDITFLRMGLDSDSVDCVAAARACLAQREYALVLTDMRLPDGLGIELVREVAANFRNTPIAVLTAFGSTDNAVAALKAGAFDYLSKPVGLDQLRLMVQSALRLADPASRNVPAGTSAITASALRLLGQSEAILDVQSQIVRLARSMAPVAIQGESGTGKELAARDIHAQSARRDKPFVAVNCGAIPEALMEAEFFGYRKGAFTGATEDRDGFFQAADGGTLLLDEVADLPLPMQVKLLRAIQERRVRKIGATAEEPVDVRLISATHQNLAGCVEQGKFRQDLYYRLNVIELKLPPLRERRDDIPMLADAVLSRLAEPGQAVQLSPAARDALCGHAFPGNVRELENILERALAFANGGIVEVGDLALRTAVGMPAGSLAGQSAAHHSGPALGLPVNRPGGPASGDSTQASAAPSNGFGASHAAGLITGMGHDDLIGAGAGAGAGAGRALVAGARSGVAGWAPDTPAASGASGGSSFGSGSGPATELRSGTADRISGAESSDRVATSTPDHARDQDGFSPALAAGEAGLPRSLPDHLDHVEREIIRRALTKTQFNRTQAAELLGISFRQLRYRMQRLSISEPDQ